MHSVPLVLTSLCSRYLAGWLLPSIHYWRCSQQALSSQAGQSRPQQLHTALTAEIKTHQNRQKIFPVLICPVLC
ncbi:hypothetical protein AMELA_G00018960 [Ameiurus melas]|uniref:Secreted protein n=1 Tax=Ameiurus melas TaxID=219545 RepID=A0A7J6BB63_AMEME|nr:hypothetical protein AMELA_G00018960 [Ameiurus melas]